MIDIIAKETYSEIYNEIAEKYKVHDFSPQKEYSLKPTLLELIGNVDNKKVLDIGCGSGYFTRVLKNAGANYVVGVDISEKQIDLAKRIENEENLGINYYIGDIRRFKLKEKFDVVSALLVLHYAETEDDLDKMIKCASSHLKNGGIFAGIVNNFDFPIGGNKEIGALTRYVEEIRDGAKIKVEIYDINKNLATSFYIFHWSKETYEKLFRKNGFDEIEWKLPMPTEEGLLNVPIDYWKNPTTIAFRCFKRIK